MKKLSILMTTLLLALSFSAMAQDSTSGYICTATDKTNEKVTKSFYNKKLISHQSYLSIVGVLVVHDVYCEPCLSVGFNCVKVCKVEKLQLTIESENGSYSNEKLKGTLTDNKGKTASLICELDDFGSVITFPSFGGSN